MQNLLAITRTLQIDQYSFYQTALHNLILLPILIIRKNWFVYALYD